MDVLPHLRRAAGCAFDLVAPPRCLACEGADAEWAGICARCVRLVRPIPPAPCPVCAAPLGPGAPVEACLGCARLRPRFAAAVAGAAYSGLGGELVRRAKYGSDELFAVPLGALLVRALEAGTGGALDEVLRAEVVVPVPTTPRRRRERGFNLAERLAEPVARRLGCRYDPRRLLRVGEPTPQAALTRAERRRAVTGTVRCRSQPRWLRFLARRRAGIAGRRVLLVDDVLTTGATANACARALLAAGACRVAVAVATRA